MRQSGTLRSWNDDRGYGFIAPTHGGAEMFFHVSALPRDGSRPTVGERLTYEIGRGKNGKPQAVDVRREAIGAPNERPVVRVSSARQGRPFLSKLIVLALVATIGAFGWSRYQKQERVVETRPTSSGLESTPDASATQATEAPRFRCDGRQHCSQMTSCKEAKYFLKNCPGVEMDGNHDGTPCEQQWCTHPFAE